MFLCLYSSSYKEKYNAAVNEGAVKEKTGKDGVTYAVITSFMNTKEKGTTHRRGVGGSRAADADEANRMRDLLSGMGWDFSFGAKQLKDSCLATAKLYPFR